ncbi:MAG: hypothetical protein KIT84_25085 [Labilithrix sp.]|nr:hypothetical protein [Labilithrix sp.]
MREHGGAPHPRSARDATTVRTDRHGAARAAVVVAVGLLLAGTMVMARASRPSRCRTAPLPRIAVTSPKITPAPTLAVPVTTSAATADSCSPPFWYDEHDVKHYKMHCIHPERAPR